MSAQPTKRPLAAKHDKVSRSPAGLGPGLPVIGCYGINFFFAGLVYLLCFGASIILSVN